jgi:hypothetical protein
MHGLLAVIEQAEAHFSAYAPDLPGCVATGATREETERRMGKPALNDVERESCHHRRWKLQGLLTRSP